MRTSSCLFLLLLIAACASPPPPPMLPPAPLSSPAPPPPPAPVADWKDAPLTPGRWTYRRDPSSSSASFADALLLLRCDRVQRVVSLAGSGVGSSISIETSFGAFLVEGPVPAFDKRLDSMAFSRGRIAISSAGMPQLIVPAWPEIARVIEDCRAQA